MLTSRDCFQVGRGTRPQLVYLPFEDQTVVTEWLNGFSEHCFLRYASTLPNDEQGNLGRRNANIAGFKSDLASTRGVVCNCGFELISECLHWRKPVLTRPLAKQMEQLSNGAASASWLADAAKTPVATLGSALWEQSSAI